MIRSNDMSDNDSDDMSRDVPRVRLVLNANQEPNESNDEDHTVTGNIARFNRLVPPGGITGLICGGATANPPVIGESFCECRPGPNGRVNCLCGEEDGRKYLIIALWTLGLQTFFLGDLCKRSCRFIYKFT